MKRKDYSKPMTQVVKLQHTGMLMTSTQGVQGNGVQNYNWNTVTEE